MMWYNYEQEGWSWSEGWSATRNCYVVQVWRDYEKKLRVDGRWAYRECLSEGGKSLDEARSKLFQRLDNLEN